MSFIIQLLVVAAAVYFAAWLLPGVHVKNYGYAIIVALVIGVLDAVVFTIFPGIGVSWILLLVVNALIILLASKIFGSDFQVDGFVWALVFALIVAVVSAILNHLIA
ncbi:MAG: phage holin family protein [Bacteroidales bacterium]|jgi:putative membrane protein|nr:phage holin family protein [Bacteroidales bacterium]